MLSDILNRVARVGAMHAGKGPTRLLVVLNRAREKPRHHRAKPSSTKAFSARWLERSQERLWQR